MGTEFVWVVVLAVAMLAVIAAMIATAVFISRTRYWPEQHGSEMTRVFCLGIMTGALLVTAGFVCAWAFHQVNCGRPLPGQAVGDNNLVWRP